MGFSDNDYMYNQQRAHSADIFFLKARAWFWGITATTISFIAGNMLGALDILDVMGVLTNFVQGLFSH